MTAPTAGPRCPRCRRPLAAWRLDHCIYCGEAFPEELRQGFAEPEGLKWGERPALPADVSKKLELLRIVPTGKAKKPRALMATLAVLAVPVFVAILYVAFTLVRQLSPTSAFLIVIVSLGAIVYVASVFFRSRK